LERHHDFLQRGVARAFANAVYRALNLSRAGLHRRQRIGHRHFAVLKFRHVVVQVRDERAVFFGHRPADGVGNVHRRRAGLDHGAANLHQKIRLRARSIFRRKFHVLHMFTRTLHTVHGQFQNLILRLAELVFAMDF